MSSPDIPKVTMNGSEDVAARENLRALVVLAAKWRRFCNMKPRRLGTFLVQAFGPWDHRRIATTQMGLRLYLDPFTTLGQEVLLHGAYEPETVEIFRRKLGPGKIFLDVGANEGFYSALAGRLVGPSGMVLAVEPQRQCRDLIEINLRINEVSWARVYSNAMGGEDGQVGRLFNYTSVNTGLSRIVSRYHSTVGVEEFLFVSPETILRDANLDRVDLVKVDVEGFEYEVVQSLVPHIRAGQVTALLLEYHPRLLSRRGISPMSVHNTVVAAGLRKTEGEPESPDGKTRVLYELE